MLDSQCTREYYWMPRDLFRFEAQTCVDGWAAIDDRVMGGVPTSRLRYDPAGHAVFGSVGSLDKSGGFAAARSRTADPGMPGASFYGLEVTLNRTEFAAFNQMAVAKSHRHRAGAHDGCDQEAGPKTAQSSPGPPGATNWLTFSRL